jgi:hypothetical protein
MESSTTHNEKNPPHEFFCPINQALMTEPHIASDGHSYEETAIKHWFSISRKTTSPMTNEILPTTTLTPNHALKKLIERYRTQMNQQLLLLCGLTNTKMSELEQIIEKGAQPNNVRDVNGNTPVHLLFTNANPGGIKILVSSGASVLATNDDGKSVLDLARARVPRKENWFNMILKMTRLEEAKIVAAAAAAAAVAKAKAKALENTNNHNDHDESWVVARGWFRGGGRLHAPSTFSAHGGGRQRAVDCIAGGFALCYLVSDCTWGGTKMYISVVIVYVYFVWSCIDINWIEDTFQRMENATIGEKLWVALGFFLVFAIIFLQWLKLWNRQGTGIPWWHR